MQSSKSASKENMNTSNQPDHQSQSTKGWNWGWYHMKQDRIDFTHDEKGGKNCFSLKYKDIAISNATTENEVQLELKQDHEANRR